MHYEILTEEEQHDILIAHLAGLERDHFCHTINKERYEKLLENMPEASIERHNDCVKRKEEPQFQDRIAHLCTTESKALEETEQIINKLKLQLPAKDKISEAVVRLKNK